MFLEERDFLRSINYKIEEKEVKKLWRMNILNVLSLKTVMKD